MAEELRPHHYWREDRITGRLVVITPDEYEQWGKDNQPSEAYRPAFTRAQLPSQVGEAVAWHTDDHLTDKSATTYDREVAERWRAKGWPVTTLYTHPADQVADDLTMVKVPRELLEDLRDCANECYNHARLRGTSGLDSYDRLTEQADAKLATLEVKS